MTIKEDLIGLTLWNNKLPVVVPKHLIESAVRETDFAGVEYSGGRTIVVVPWETLYVVETPDEITAKGETKRLSWEGFREWCYSMNVKGFMTALNQKLEDKRLQFSLHLHKEEVGHWMEIVSIDNYPYSSKERRAREEMLLCELVKRANKFIEKEGKQ